MRVGINLHVQYSFFSNGLATCSLSLAEALKQFGHSVSFVGTKGSNSWFDDVIGLKDHFPVVKMEDVTTPFDLFIDVDGWIPVELRRSLGVRYVVFVRKPIFLHEIESSVYPMRQPTPNYRACDAVWTWEHFGAQDAHLMEIISERPVFRIPFTWSSLAVDDFGKEIPNSWLEQSKKVDKGFPWSCHISETNMTNANNCTLPLVCVSYAKKQDALPIQKIYIHNAQHLESMEYFKKNILEHTEIYGLERAFVGRQRCTDWRSQPKSFVFTHIRFLQIKTMMVDCLWNGIPVVHNSPWLKKLGLGYYYKDNNILESVACMKQMNNDYMNSTGFFAEGALKDLRSKLHGVLSPVTHTSVWERAITITSSSIPCSIQVEKIEAIEAIDAIERIEKEKEQGVEHKKMEKEKTELLVGFSDMWQNMNCSYNFWTLLLTEALKASNHPIKKVRGIHITPVNVYEVSPYLDLLFFAPFGETWQMVPSSVPKIHITGENTEPKEGAFLNLGFAATDEAKGIFRFPLWIQYLDWFGADQEQLVNPRTMPLSSVFGEKKIESRSKFCAFIVSNPCCQIRNEAFHALSTYKKVDSAGRLFNNIGDLIFSENAGGGGGELKKLAFLQDYKFCIAYENSSTPGYVTEKLLAAKAAGCVPIYWGAADVSQDFDPASFLHVSACSMEEMVNKVCALDTNSEEWTKMAQTPGIVGGIEGCRQKLATVAKKILERVAGFSSINFPSVLGNTLETAPKSELLVLEDVSTDGEKKDVLYVSFATQNYLPSLQHWLSSVLPRKGAAVRIYLGQDIRSETISALKSQFSKVDFQQIPEIRVEGFPDIWNPQHFAWKIFLFNTLAHDSSLDGMLVWYTDIGSLHIRWPAEYAEKVKKDEIVVLEDKSQKNEQWCHTRFCEILNVTDEEKKAHQIWAGGLMFMGGSKKARYLFSEAWILAQSREVIVGPKWSGTLADGRPYGHRHDQSILSVLRLRHKISSYPLELVYCDESARRTYKSGAAVYVHRGRPIENLDFAPGIADVHIVSLTRRKDRLDNFMKTHGPWTKKISLRPAYDGRSLSLTPALARLFGPNDFMWKKSVAGCALSHLHLWMELAAEPDSCDTYLILEDDVKFNPQWLDVWVEAAKEIPADFDVLYLGGVLPPNRPGFDMLLEPVNKSWNRIALNNMFGQNPPTRYFHFCTYAYIINRRGAKKLLQTILHEGGYRTSADHMMCNRVDTLNYYCTNPLLAGCCEDDNPAYKQSAFNNFDRVDTFDSDIWNNNERFSQEEIHNCLSKAGPLDIGRALLDAQTSFSCSFSKKYLTVYPLKTNIVNFELNWLKNFFGSSIDTVSVVDKDHTPLDCSPTFILQRPHIDSCVAVLKKYEEQKKPFSILHVSDEYGSDPIDYYAFSMCKKVYRNYSRPLDPSVESKVVVFPLGYSKNLVKRNEEKEDGAGNSRPLFWSFFATAWHNRQDIVNILKKIEPHEYKLFPEWNDPGQLSPEMYSEKLYQSIFVPCVRGQNHETFRFYEALECGAIPIYVKEKDDVFFSFVSKKLPLFGLDSWYDALNLMENLLGNPEVLVKYRTEILQKWKAWKEELREVLK